MSDSHELTSKDCICRMVTVSAGPEYSLEISPNCPWHNRSVSDPYLSDCTVCHEPFGPHEPCRCDDARAFLNRLYGYSAVNNELHEKDVLALVRLMREERKEGAKHGK